MFGNIIIQRKILSIIGLRKTDEHDFYMGNERHTDYTMTKQLKSQRKAKQETDAMKPTIPCFYLKIEGDFP